jgi:hypothetical protein
VFLKEEDKKKKKEERATTVGTTQNVSGLPLFALVMRDPYRNGTLQIP